MASYGGGSAWLQFVLNWVKDTSSFHGRTPAQIHAFMAGAILGILQTESENPPTGLVLSPTELADLVLQEHIEPGIRQTEFELDLGYEKQLGNAIRAWVRSGNRPDSGRLAMIRESFSLMRQGLIDKKLPFCDERVPATGNVYSIPIYDLPPSGLMLCDKLFFAWMSALRPAERTHNFAFLIDYIPRLV